MLSGAAAAALWVVCVVGVGLSECERGGSINCLFVAAASLSFSALFFLRVCCVCVSHSTQITPPLQAVPVGEAPLPRRHTPKP